MDYFNSIDEKESKEVVPAFFARSLHTENVTLVFREATEGSSFPEHSHPHEQIFYYQKGKFELVINGETKILHEGVVAIIPLMLNTPVSH